MDISLAQKLARNLMNDHGLNTWQLKFGRAKNTAGSCRTGLITLSAHCMSLYSEKEVRDTVLHEIAHALAGPGHGHDYVWRAKCIEIGGTGAQYVSKEAPRPVAKYTGTCPNGHQTQRHARSDKMFRVSCSRCAPYFDPKFKYTWVENVVTTAAALREPRTKFAAGSSDLDSLFGTGD